MQLPFLFLSSISPHGFSSSRCSDRGNSRGRRRECEIESHVSPIFSDFVTRRKGQSQSEFSKRRIKRRKKKGRRYRKRIVSYREDRTRRVRDKVLDGVQHRHANSSPTVRLDEHRPATPESLSAAGTVFLRGRPFHPPIFHPSFHHPRKSIFVLTFELGQRLLVSVLRSLLTVMFRHGIGRIEAEPLLVISLSGHLVNQLSSLRIFLRGCFVTSQRLNDVFPCSSALSSSLFFSSLSRLCRNVLSFLLSFFSTISVSLRSPTYVTYAHKKQKH